MPACWRSTGEVVNSTKVGINKGYIGLEAEGYSITFEDMKLEELP